jgi:hypothetical protein
MTFTMWSFGHYLFMLSPFFLLLLLNRYTKKSSLENNRKIGIVLSLVAIIILLLRNIEIWVARDFRFDIELVPLQVCHFANFVLLFAFMTKKQTWFNLALTLNLPAAFVSILFANSLANYSTIVSFRGFAYIFGHILLVTIPLWAYHVGFIKLNMNSFIKTLKLVATLYFLSLFINNLMYVLFGQYSNYFYSLKPERGTPLEAFFKFGENRFLFDFFQINPVYILLTGIFGLLVMFSLYTLFYLNQTSMLKEGFKKLLFSSK